MAYTLLFQKSDTVATWTIGASTGAITLTNGNFTVVGEQLYVIDYDTTSAEVVKATVSGTTMTITERAVDGTSVATHGAGSTVIMALVPSHYQDILDGGSFTTGSDTKGISVSALKFEGWSTYEPDFYNEDAETPLTGTTNIARYKRIGNTIICTLFVNAIDNANGQWIFADLPVAADELLNTAYLGAGYTNNGSSPNIGLAYLYSGINDKVAFTYDYSQGLWGDENNAFNITFIYEAA